MNFEDMLFDQAASEKTQAIVGDIDIATQVRLIEHGFVVSVVQNPTEIDRSSVENADDYTQKLNKSEIYRLSAYVKRHRLEDRIKREAARFQRWLKRQSTLVETYRWLEPVLSNEDCMEHVKSAVVYEARENFYNYKDGFEATFELRSRLSKIRKLFLKRQKTPWPRRRFSDVLEEIPEASAFEFEIDWKSLRGSSKAFVLDWGPIDRDPSWESFEVFDASTLKWFSSSAGQDFLKTVRTLIEETPAIGERKAFLILRGDANSGWHIHDTQVRCPSVFWVVGFLRRFGYKTIEHYPKVTQKNKVWVEIYW